MTSIDSFKDSIKNNTPDPSYSPMLTSLWYDAYFYTARKVIYGMLITGMPKQIKPDPIFRWRRNGNLWWKHLTLNIDPLMA
jgi:hypothetical protein